MNERIKELAKQAGLEMCSCGCDMPTRQTVAFAELIVAKCVEIADDYSDSGIIPTKINKYFGVEE
jgi:hypothetical protein